VTTTFSASRRKSWSTLCLSSSKASTRRSVRWNSQSLTTQEWRLVSSQTASLTTRSSESRIKRSKLSSSEQKNHLKLQEAQELTVNLNLIWMLISKYGIVNFNLNDFLCAFNTLYFIESLELACLCSWVSAYLNSISELHASESISR
jgi:hypothetical protein